MILILNCGSQSIKWKIFGEDLKLVKQNKLDVFNLDDFSAQGEPASGWERTLTDELSKIKEDIYLVGHRVVHGGENFRKPLKITEENLKEMEKINHLAPLHNPYNVLGIKVCKDIFKNAEQFAVFDTEFFSDLPEKAYRYALSEEVVKELGFRRYGFQGISHEYVARKAAETIKKPFEKLKIITCHLGGGASIAAIKNGKAIDTSMGFTPLEGLVMMTRAGNIDTGIVLELVEKFSLDQAKEILNKEAGIKGICGEGNMIKVLEKMEKGEKKEKLAFDMFVYSIQKYIGSYFAILGGCDVLVFTGSIGAGKPITRNSVCKDLKILSKTKILAIDSDEELLITQKLLNIK